MFIAFFIMSIGALQAQILEPVKWTTSVEKISDTAYTLMAKASIEKGWHLYAQDLKKGGPTATAFYFEVDGYCPLGKTLEGEGHIVI